MVTANAVIAYIYKYCYKGSDMAKARVMYGGDEIEAYRIIRYISSSEAMWRIFGFDMQNVPRMLFSYMFIFRANRLLSTTKTPFTNNGVPQRTTP